MTLDDFDQVIEDWVFRALGVFLVLWMLCLIMAGLAAVCFGIYWGVTSL